MDEGFLDAASGKYDRPTTCGNCFTDCTAIYARPNATGTCDATAAPTCVMACDAGWYDLNAIPVDGCELHLDAAAIYVSIDDPAADDAIGCGRGPAGTGPAHRPCRHLAQGIVEAVASGRTRVLVADGRYDETVTVASGISLLGGHRPDTWERHVAGTLTTVRGSSAGLHRKTIVADSVGAPTLIEGFVIEGPVNPNASGNSYAVWVRNSGSALEIRNNRIQGGTGGTGADGSPGGNGVPGVDGVAGQAPIELASFELGACTGNPLVPGNQGPEGNGGARSCATISVDGGNGGGAVCPNLNAQAPGGTNGRGVAAGSGGEGDHDRTSTDCLRFVMVDGSARDGGPGGDGGAGGHGGGAGGGCGGASYGIYVHNLTAPPAAYKTGNTFTAGGSGGSGGAGGPSYANVGSAGAQGASGDANF